MIYKPPPLPDIQNKDELRKMMRMTIKKILKDDPELLSEIVSELRKDKLKKITDKLN
jgi:hypothetical protein